MYAQSMNLERDRSEVVRQVVYSTKLPWWIGGSMFGLSAEVGVALPASVASWTRRASRKPATTAAVEEEAPAPKLHDLLPGVQACLFAKQRRQ